MNIFIKNSIKVTVFLWIAFLSSCNKFDSYLDKAESGGMSEEEVFGNYRQTERFLAQVYGSGLKIDWVGGGLWSFSYDGATDNGYSAYRYWPSPKFVYDGTLTPANNPIDQWADSYAALRRVNMFLEKIDQLPVSNQEEETGKVRMKGEAYFLRAWFYAELFKRYGAVPLIDRVLQVSDDLNIPRASASDIISFISEDCDRAAALLPDVYTTKDIGRATKGAALALKSRMLLYFASALHNSANDLSRWEKAATAAQEVMKLGVYNLHQSFKDVLHNRTSSETIFQYTANYEDQLRNNLMPSQGGFAIVTPSQELVDAFEMQDGHSISESSMYDPERPYDNRDPRFKMTIIHNELTWRGVPIETFEGGLDGINGNGDNYTRTGYYLAKTLDENGSITPIWRPGSHFFVFIRYAEILLNYAEAKNEALPAPDQSVYQAIDAVRARVGMPALPAGLSKDQMRTRIRNERRVELAFESHRFWDIRRWKIGEQVMKEVHGMKITKSGNAYNYQRFKVENRFYKNTYDLFPIPQSEMNRNHALVQNPEYN
ncbi:RagB/SusD family nutrient uptake outer membrane protein [Sphingobacterium chuzhouense]|uniref:RagB/SusD family nutrient uptake outer membrane protein n=1 Tax=Sphingobacterium chuzhouense TaxID=1742264 RepID=A0ABR7XS84_9SPHI|nr:RagB/SusD family nutrient uptake outer membrane protein [Sphingobacterium chuzhouense]MBD1422025.1 RagB/SusD family nutrient uptake outer membrane protein [Sphingobacterium chuzhouense]